jgi:hypothetical protein
MLVKIAFSTSLLIIGCGSKNGVPGSNGATGRDGAPGANGMTGPTGATGPMSPRNREKWFAESRATSLPECYRPAMRVALMLLAFAAVALASVLVAGCGNNSSGAFDMQAAPSPDLYTPDLSTPDLSTPDLSTPDLSTPDLSTPDLSMPDFSVADQLMADLEPPRDLSHPPDLTPMCSGNGSVDVNQPSSNEDVMAPGTYVVGQAFTVGRSGILDAIAPLFCIRPGAPNGNVTLSVFNGTQMLASTTVASTSLSCAGTTRFAIGCIPVVKGMSLRFEMTTNIPIACNSPPAGQCTGTIWPCNTSDDCDVLDVTFERGTSPVFTLQGVPATGLGALEFSTFVE